MRLLSKIVLGLITCLLSACASYQGAPIDNFSYPPDVTASNNTPKTVVLLLPSKGDFGHAGQMIQAGFMTASQTSPNPLIKIVPIDTSNYNTPDSAYQAALSEQPTLIIGPLTKPEVNALVLRNNLPVATLALNQIDVDLIAPLNLYQFSLSPQADAVTTANKMDEAGFNQAIVIAPNGDWGQGIATSFGQAWLAKDKKIVDSIAYQPNQLFAESIKNLFQQNSDSDLKNTAIIVIANPKEANKILPILRQYGKNLPIYGLSMIYDGSNLADLDNVHFAVSDWMKTPSNAAHNDFNAKYPQAPAADGKLYAFGLDAYALAQYTLINSGFTGVSMPAQSGYLTINTNGIVQRTLSWMTVKQGQLIEKPSASGSE